MNFKKLASIGIAVISLLVLFNNCEKGGGGSSSALSPLAAKYQGKYFNEYTSGANFYRDEVEVSGNSVILRNFVFTSQFPVHGFHRENKGTFSESGNSITITYSKETCHPVGSETLVIGGDSAQFLSISQGGTTLVYKNSEAFDTTIKMTSLVSLTEDTNCNQF